MLKELSNNLNMLMAKARLSSSELARQIGIPATTIKRIRNNEQSNPTITTLIPIAQYFSISLNQLIGNEDLISDKEAPIVLYKIPLLSWNECIHYSSLTDENYLKQIFTERNVSSKAFALIVEDNDLDFFPKESILIIEPNQNPENGDYVVIGNIQHNVASIRKYIIEIDRIYLKSLVAGLSVSILTPEYKILGVIIQYKVELK